MSETTTINDGATNQAEKLQSPLQSTEDQSAIHKDGEEQPTNDANEQPTDDANEQPGDDIGEHPDKAGSESPAGKAATESTPSVPGEEHEQELCNLVADEKVICQAAKEGDLEVLQYLINSGKVSINVCDKDKWRPLHFAAHAGQLETVKFLLDNGADACARKGDSSTALHDAAYIGNTAVCEILLKHQVDINEADEDGWTALHYAAASGHVDVLRLLIQHSADPTLQTKDGKTVYKLAFAEGHQDALRLLEEMTDVKGDKAALQGAASSRIMQLEDELARVLAEKQELQEALLRKEEKPPQKEEKKQTKEAKEEEEESKEANNKKQRKKGKKKDKAEAHEEAAEALDQALESFGGNADELEQLIKTKQAEVEEAEGAEYGREEMELYFEKMMEIYSLRAEDVNVNTKCKPPPEGTAALVLPGRHHHLPVTCLFLVDALYHPYLKDRLARQVAYISTTTHPNLALFIGVCFRKRQAEVEAETKGGRRKKGGASNTDHKPTDESSPTPPLPYQDADTKDHEICLVYEPFEGSLQKMLQPGSSMPPKDIVKIMLGISAAVAHLHRRGHVHNAICSQNVMVNTLTMTAKLTHFGVNNVSNVFRRLKLHHGPQRWYCAPEQLDPNPKKPMPPPSQFYDFGCPKSDIYSLGMVLAALCTMKEDHGKPADLARGVKLMGLRDLIYMTTKLRPDDRSTADEVVAYLSTLQRSPEYT